MSGDAIGTMVGQYDPVAAAGTNLSQSAVQLAIENYRVQTAVSLSFFVGLIQVS